MSYYNHIRKFEEGGRTQKNKTKRSFGESGVERLALDIFGGRKAPVSTEPLPNGHPVLGALPPTLPAFQNVSRRPASKPVSGAVSITPNPVTVTPVVTTPVVAATTAAAATSTTNRKVTPAVAGSSSKGTAVSGKIKFIQRSLGVKADGLWGPKTQAAFEKMKATQESLGLTGKDVDGIRGMKTREALNKRDNEVSSSIKSLKVLDTNDRSKDPILNPVKSMTNRESRQEGRRVRRILREEERELRRNARREDADFAFRKGGILYAQRK